MNLLRNLLPTAERELVVEVVSGRETQGSHMIFIHDTKSSLALHPSSRRLAFVLHCRKFEEPQAYQSLTEVSLDFDRIGVDCAVHLLKEVQANRKRTDRGNRYC